VGERTTRIAAIAALSIQPVFFAYWLIAGWLEPHYSPAREFVSEMGAPGMAAPWLLDLMLVVWGISMVLAAIAIRRARPAAMLMLVAGVACALAGPLHMECVPSLHPHCPGIHEPTQQAHQWLSLINELALTFSVFAVAAVLWPRALGKALLVPASVGLAVFILGFFAKTGDPHAGLAQRLGILAAQGWIGLLALWALVARPAR
jgi:hypothetical protein